MAGNPVYLDTSGVLAFLNASDDCHSGAVSAWTAVLEGDGGFVMTEYARLESWSLIQRRLGLEAAGDFKKLILPLCRVLPVGEAGFERLSTQALLSRRRQLSLVDLSSFDCMLREGLKRALAFDKHFIEQGFITPESPDW